MGLDVGEIGLDLSLFAEKSVQRLVAKAAAAEKNEAIKECIRSLEVEKGKIEAFKRELPLCMRLIVYVIEMMKEEAEKRRLEEKAGDAAAGDDKKSWMSTAQLWVDNRSGGEKRVSDGKQSKERSSPETRGHGGTFVPFKCGAAGLSDLSMLSPTIKSPPLVAPVAARPAIASMPPAPAPAPGTQLSLQSQQQAARKARRCWSPELHKQFVAALHQLGGPLVATPKQIRELMKVDSLTNDEVKSHLQKYRLHNRRAPNAPSMANQSIVLVRGLWDSPEKSSSQSGSPQGPLQYSGCGVAVSAASCEEDGKSESHSWK